MFEVEVAKIIGFLQYFGLIKTFWSDQNSKVLWVCRAKTKNQTPWKTQPDFCQTGERKESIVQCTTRGRMEGFIGGGGVGREGGRVVAEQLGTAAAAPWELSRRGAAPPPDPERSSSWAAARLPPPCLGPPLPPHQWRSHHTGAGRPLASNTLLVPVAPIR